MKDLQLLDSTHPDLAVAAERNDIVLNGNEFVTIEDAPRKVQDVIKALITQVGSNNVYPNYGSRLPSLPGTRKDANFTEAVADSVLYTMGYLQANEESTKPSERIRRIISLNLDTTTDPLSVMLILALELEDGSSLTSQVLLGR